MTIIRDRTPGPKEGGIMLDVTQAATMQVAEYFKGQDPTPIRIFLNQGG